MPLFRDRHDAGRQLAALLGAYAHDPRVLVLGLPRGGVPVAYEVADALAAPLDLFLVRKLGVPGHEELAMGAIAPGGVRILNPEIVNGLGLSPEEIESVTAMEERELARRERRYRGDRPPPNVRNRTVILVDDGLATGSTMQVAVAALRLQSPHRIVVGVPVSAPSTCRQFHTIADEIVCAATPDPFFAVGLWYEDFAPTSDEEVIALLDRERGRPSLGWEGSVAAEPEPFTG